MKQIFLVIAATFICGASLFTSCTKDEDLKLEESWGAKEFYRDADSVYYKLD